MNLTETTRLIAVLRAVHPHLEIADGMADAWASLMVEISYPDAEAALYRLSRETGRIPDPAVILAEHRRYRIELRSQQAEVADDAHCGRSGCPCSHSQGCYRGWLDAEAGTTPCPNCRPGRQQRAMETRRQWFARLRQGA
jgi:hypothetical protein